MTQPHPLTFCAYLMASVAENVLNHSGLDHWFTRLGRSKPSVPDTEDVMRCVVLPKRDVNVGL
jgi:hypothetical protein